MSFENLVHEPSYLAVKETVPLMSALVERYQDEKPFTGLEVVFGHLLVMNTIPMLEAITAGGAKVNVAEGHFSPATKPVRVLLAKHGIDVLPNIKAVRHGDLYMDVNAVLGRLKAPKGVAEVTRTGVLHYQEIPCTVVSADDCKTKKIEGFFGTGDGFVRAWREMRRDDPLDGKRLVQFGYGKIGRGVAHVTRRTGMQVTVVEVAEAAKSRAVEDGFKVIDGSPNSELEKALAKAEVVISVTSIPKIISKAVPAEWLRANQPVLVNLGAEDEFGEKFRDEEILGGKALPLNFHLAEPTRNHYVDAPLAAHLMALEALVQGNYPQGIHPLPEAMDDWLLSEWRKHWPEEDLTGIGEELGLV